MSETATLSLHVSQLAMQGVGIAGVLGLVALAGRGRARTRAGQQVSSKGAAAPKPVMFIRRAVTKRRLARGLARTTQQLHKCEPIGSKVPDGTDTRINALLSLERVAQDAVRHGAGHLHIRAMEALCAFVREAAPAAKASDYPLPDWEPLGDTPTEDEKAHHLVLRDTRFANLVNSNARDWAMNLTPPRKDIQLALRIIGRRTRDQCVAEAAVSSDRQTPGVSVFDTPCPELEPCGAVAKNDIAHINQFQADLRGWKDTLAAYRGYRPDLRDTNLQAADLSGLNLSGFRLDRARLEGAVMREALLDGAILRGARMEGAELRNARLRGADLRRARLEGACLRNVEMQGADLRNTRLEWVNFQYARLEGAEFHAAQMEVASFYKANLQGAVFFRAMMDSAVLYQSRLDGADMREASLRWTNMRDSRLDGALLSSARLDGADLGAALLHGVDLFEARLDGAAFHRAQVCGVIFSKPDADGYTSVLETNFQQTLLTQVDLSLVPINQSQIDQCLGDDSVILPERIRTPQHWTLSTDADTLLQKWHQWRGAAALKRKDPENSGCDTPESAETRSLPDLSEAPNSDPL